MANSQPRATGRIRRAANMVGLPTSVRCGFVVSRSARGGRAVAGAGQAHGGEDCRDHASWLVSAPMARNMAGPETSLTAK
jgi:hypothetical protein